MIQLIPQLNVLIACESVDFRCGIDGLAALCKNQFACDPMSGTMFVFRNKRGTTLKILCYDGLGFWLITRRFSSGKLRYWPSSADTLLHPMQAQELNVILFQGSPVTARFSDPWRKLSHQDPQVTAATSPAFP